MKNKNKFLGLVLVVLLIAVLAPIGSALAQGVDPSDPVATLTDPTTVERAIDMAFLVAITGFFKEQLQIKGKRVLVVAFVVGLVLWFMPEISSIHPVVAVFMAFVKWFLGGLGAFDTAIDTSGKIAAEQQINKLAVNEAAAG